MYIQYFRKIISVRLQKKVENIGCYLNNEYILKTMKNNK